MPARVLSPLIALVCLLLCTAGQAQEASYVGSQSCKGCHQDQFTLWQGSHHDWAMKPANANSVLGNFEQTRFNHYGLETRFFKRGDDFYVRTDNSAGQLQDFKIDYTFGFYPLQQYLINIGDGHLQALSIAWDSRPKKEGGQRWFHLHPDEKIPAGDALHWTGPYYNWNNRCAECHSTNLRKNYNAETNRYNTQWSEINVACESCHGPGSLHVAAASKKQPAKNFINGLNPVGQWLLKQGDTTAKRDLGPRKAGEKNSQMAVCASCHSRRGLLNNPAQHKAGQDFFDSHRLSLIQSPLYHQDGQIKDEVYVYGSFMQSEMFHQGVQCSNCHEPHSLKLRAPGNAVCSQCHVPSVYDQPKHHKHTAGSQGADCANCHMPETTYMGVDPRRDHSIRIPRPDLSLQHKTPNACNQCHQDKSVSWAAKHFQRWFKQPMATPVLLSAQPLMAVQKDINAIAKASLLAGFSQAPSRQALNLLQHNLTSKEPVVRLAALAAMAAYDIQRHWAWVKPLLQDPVKAVRLDAVRLLLNAPKQWRSKEEQAHWLAALNEYKTTLDFHNDSAAGQLNLGGYYLSLGDEAAAAKAYGLAIRREPFNPAAYLNFADLLRQQNKETEAMHQLQLALVKAPQSAEVHHALGLAHIRIKQYPPAIVSLAKAHQLAADNARFAFVYAVALNSTGQQQQALEVLENWQQNRSININIVNFLVQLYRQSGDMSKVQYWRNKLPQRVL